jgi:hypothetical protein
MPGLISNTINLKQFRRSDDPDHFCYQAVTNGRLSTTAFNGGGFLGEERLLAGDLSGGFSIKLHEWPSLPIVETLGLDVAARWRGQGADVAQVKPVMPFWYNVNMVYLQGINVAWRAHDGIWRDDNGQPIGSRAKVAAKSDDTLFNTTVGSAVDAVAGPFQFSGTTIRVLPLVARRAKLVKFLDSYINTPLADSGDGRNVRLALWAPPASKAAREGDDIEGNDAQGGADCAYVYLTATSFEDVLSKTNNIGDWAKFELAFLVPVKWEHRDTTTGEWELAGVGLVPAYTFVDDTTAAVARAEVLGIPTTRAMFVQPESAWMSEEGANAGAPQLLLRVNAEVLPAMGEGQQSQVRTIVDISEGDYNAGIGALESRVTADRWAGILRQELERKKRTKHDRPAEIQNARALALELLGNHVPFSFYTIKQFRDVVDPDRACYQSIVRVARVLDEVLDVREIEETVRIRIHDFPTLPLVESLGIVGKTIKDDGAGIVYGTQAVRPFTLRVQMDEELGERLLSRAGTLEWSFGDAPFASILAGNPAFAIGVLAESAQDQGDPRRIERTVRDWSAAKRGEKPLTVGAAKKAIGAIDPQMVVEAVLSREWGNWSETARWRRGRHELERMYAAAISGVSNERLIDAQTAFFEGVYERAGHRPGEPPMNEAAPMIKAMATFTARRLEMETHWTVLAEWGVTRMYGTEKVKTARATPSAAVVRSSIIAFIDSLERIARLQVIGDPAGPDRGMDYEVRDNGSRLQELLTTALDPIRLSLQSGPKRGGLQGYLVTLDEAWMLRDVCTSAVALARKRCDFQREALFNKLSRAWQKPDYCVKRDAAGVDRDRLFPLAESWDDDWYYGRSVSTKSKPKAKVDR